MGLGEEKRKRLFWTHIWFSFFFGGGGKRFEAKHKKQKKNKATNIETLPNKYLRETHVPYFNENILEDEESVKQPQATDNGRGGKTKMQYGTSEFILKWCGA